MILEETHIGFNSSFVTIFVVYLLSLMITMLFFDSSEGKEIIRQVLKYQSKWLLNLAILSIPVVPTLFLMAGFEFTFERDYKNFEKLQVSLESENKEVFEPIEVKLNREMNLKESPDFRTSLYKKAAIEDSKSIYEPNELFYAEIEYNDGFKDTTVVYKGYVKVEDSDSKSTYFSYLKVDKKLSKKWDLKEGNYLPTIYLAKKDKE